MFVGSLCYHLIRLLGPWILQKRLDFFFFFFDEFIYFCWIITILNNSGSLKLFSCSSSNYSQDLNLNVNSRNASNIHLGSDRTPELSDVCMESESSSSCTDGSSSAYPFSFASILDQGEVDLMELLERDAEVVLSVSQNDEKAEGDETVCVFMNKFYVYMCK
jgi:hypothetical protein